MEAMSLGVVPVVTDAGGNAELVLDGQCGIVVPVKDPNKMAEALLLLATDNVLRDKFSKAAVTRIKKDFTIEKTVKETIMVYEDLIQ